MNSNHIAPGFTAGVGLYMALSAADAECTVFAEVDDLSHGPIDAQSLRRHAAGWLFGDVTAREVHPRHIAWLPAHGRWDPRILDADTPTVFWFGSGSAQEMCSMLYFASAAAGRPWSFIDVTKSSDYESVAAMSPSELELLVGTQIPVDGTRSGELAERWRILQNENAPFRVLIGSTLTSVPQDHFDALLLRHTLTRPTPMSRVIAETMGRTQSGPVADYVLRGRLIELVLEGKIAAEGNPSTMESCFVRRTGA